MNRKKCRDCTTQKKGAGGDGFHPKVPMDVTKETMGKIVGFLQKVEHKVDGDRNKLAQRCSSCSEECHKGEADCADADFETLVGSVEGIILCGRKHILN